MSGVKLGVNILLKTSIKRSIVVCFLLFSVSLHSWKLWFIFSIQWLKGCVLLGKFELHQINQKEFRWFERKCFYKGSKYLQPASNYFCFLLLFHENRQKIPATALFLGECYDGTNYIVIVRLWRFKEVLEILSKLGS